MSHLLAERSDLALDLEDALRDKVAPSCLLSGLLRRVKVPDAYPFHPEPGGETLEARDEVRIPLVSVAPVVLQEELESPLVREKRPHEPVDVEAGVVIGNQVPVLLRNDLFRRV